eukprot:1247072-Heterocapsa_arctica.AAC.1
MVPALETRLGAFCFSLWLPGSARQSGAGGRALRSGQPPLCHAIPVHTDGDQNRFDVLGALPPGPPGSP